MSKIEQLREDYDTANEDCKDGDFHLAFIEMEKVAKTALEMIEQISKVIDE